MYDDFMMEICIEQHRKIYNSDVFFVVLVNEAVAR